MKTFQRLAMFLVILSLPALALTGCGGDDAQDEVAAQSTTDDHAATTPAPAAHTSAPADGFLTGEIIETMNSGGYSYVLVDTGDRRVWVAGPETPGLVVGQKISFAEGMEMKNFNAKSLDRSFESIFFVSAINSGSASGGMGGMGGMVGMGQANAHGGQVNPGSSNNMKVDNAHVDGVTKLDGGYTVADIYAKAADLANQNVKLRGRVVKFSRNIMGTNWAHIQDGTGEGSTSDLTVTTSAMLSVGDLVVVDGPLSVDKDFGAGYKYHVIIEGATVISE